ncbi:MAG: hypothetical protein LBR81_06380 [Prevotellaceae bacterium]|nr:hypothetical protein [Prevotellaceae bacterium]
MENKHSEAIPAEVLADVQKKMDEAAALLKPYLFNLTPEERHLRLKLGDKSLAFGEKAYDYAVANPQFCPSFLDMDMFGIDMKDTTGLRVLELSLQQLLQGIDDTVMISGSEAYNQSLVFYNAVKQAAQQGIPGAKAIYEDLKVRFATRPVKK